MTIDNHIIQNKKWKEPYNGNKFVQYRTEKNIKYILNLYKK